MRPIGRMIIAAVQLFLSFAIGAAASEGQLYFRHFDAGSGLPDNNIRCVTMLPDGLLCIQTSTALSLFNGATFENYRFDQREIPYSEYTGLTDMYYDGEDNILWGSSGDKHWVFDLSTKTFEYDLTSRLQGYGLPRVEPDEVYVQSDGTLWLITIDGDIWICNRQDGSLHHRHLPTGMHGPLALCEYAAKVWVLSLEGRLAQYDSDLSDFQWVRTIDESLSSGSSSRFELDIARDGTLWMMFDRSIYSYSPTGETLTKLSEPRLSESDLFTSIALDSSDDLWIGTARSGLSIRSHTDGACRTLPYLETTGGERIYPHTDISKVYADHQGGMWIATQVEGLVYHHRSIIRLDGVCASSMRGGSLCDDNVKSLLQNPDGTILMGTVRGLVQYDPEAHCVTMPYPELNSEICICLYRDSSSRLWVGTFYDGVYCIDGGRVRHFGYPEMGSVDLSYQESKPNYNCVRALMEDANGTFWISVYGGVGTFDPETGRIELCREHHDSLERFMMVRDIRPLSKDVAIACGDNGSYLFSLSDGGAPIESNYLGGAEAEMCTQALVDSRGLLWLAQGDGLRVYDSGGIVEHISTPSIMSIVEDAMGNLWASSFASILRVRVDVDEGYSFSTTTYSSSDGVDAGTFFQNSAVALSGGNIYFGGSHGMCVIDPNAMSLEDYGISPYISSLLVNGEPRQVTPGEALSLRHDESSLTFNFTNLNYANPTLSSYRYRLEPIEKQWQESSSQALGEVRYSYLPAGEYTFVVSSAANGMDWSTPTTVRFTIRPPFYRSNTAYLLYVIVGLMVLGGITLAVLARIKRQSEERSREEEHKRQEELDQMKFRFFTNISHELRTPLSLIMLPLDSLINEESDTGKLSKLETMHTNASELLSLVNHLLDFRRIEMGGERLQLAKGDIGEFIDNVVATFRDGMGKKELALDFENTLTHPIVAYDSAKIQKVVSNLLSNTMKFTPAGGYVSVKVYDAPEGRIGIQVSDSGVGIKSEDLPRIFDRFFRSNSAEGVTGNGIGLSIIKQYVDMHGGSIEVQSEYGKGSTFTVTIPSDLKVPETEEPVNGPVAEASGLSTEGSSDAGAMTSSSGALEGGRVRVMVVDDNESFRGYLSEELSKHYTVIVAEDGRQCLDMLSEAHPDIVVCDVMMPNMDGFEVTKAIKSNINTSHIPVILLTARASDDFRLEGYETGADAYITKPFKMELLEARIRNLIEERQKRIATFSKQVDVSPMQMTITTIDQELMSKIMQSIEGNMDNIDYSVEDLASDVGMHRMSLYRKIQSLTGMTPLEFIRTMRLKRAAQLIQSDPHLSVADVSIMVGFGTVKYFSKYFKEMFGVSPSQYVSHALDS